MGNVGQSIPRIYVSLHNRKVDHQPSIINMDCNICDHVFSILFDLESMYNLSSDDPCHKSNTVKASNLHSYSSP